MAKISVIYHHYPHYRESVMRALSKSTRHNYSFFGGHEDHAGIKAFKGDEEVKVEQIEFIRKNGKIDINGFEKAIAPPFNATIIIGNINMVGSWKALAQARRNGLSTAYWAHGWIKPEIWLKAKIRNYYYGRADRVLVYGDRSRVLAEASGFSSKNIRVIWNSLNWEKQSFQFNLLASTPRKELRRDIKMPQDAFILLTISRVTDSCHYDWLIMASAKLRTMSIPVEIWMIGDGPQLQNLISMASQFKVPLHAGGAQYDESLIAKQIMAADLVVSPGKVGLTAMHALAYGTPVITHGDFDRQMPEVEALVEGESGAFFKYGDIDDLARVLLSTLSVKKDYSEIRECCRASLNGRFTPSDQARLIDDAMDEITNG